MRLLRLKDLGRWHGGGTPPRDQEQHWGGDIPWISAKDIAATALREPVSFVTEEAAAAYSRLVPAGSLLIIVRGMALAHGLPVVRVDRRVAFNQDLRALVCAPGIDPRFVYYALIGHRWKLDQHIDRAAHGTARVNESIYSERLLIPEPNEQARIVQFLNRESVRIDELLALLKAQVNAVVTATDESRRKALEHFACQHLRDAASISFGFAFDSNRFSDSPDGRLRIARIRDLLGDDEPIYSNEEAPAWVGIDSGDILVGMDGDFNVATWERGRALLNQRCAVVRPKPGHASRFLRHAIIDPLQRVNALKFSTTVKHLSAGDLRKLPIPRVEETQQRRLGAILDGAAARRDQVVLELGELAAQLAAYRAALITEAVGGRLDERSIVDPQLSETGWRRLSVTNARVRST